MPIDAGYSWAESPAIHIFFIVVSAIAVPIWVFRMAKRLKTRLSLGAERLSSSSTATGARAQSFLAKEQEDRRGDKDRRRCADDNAENDRYCEAAQDFAANKRQRQDRQ